MVGLEKLDKQMRFFTYALVGLVMIGAPGADAQPRMDSTAHRLGVELVDALNSGDNARQLDFIAANLDADALKKKPASDWGRELSFLYGKTGGFDPEPVAPSTIPPGPIPPGVAILLLHSKRDNYWLNLRVVLSQEEKGKLLGYFLSHQEDPRAVNGGPWPSGKLTEPALVG